MIRAWIVVVLVAVGDAAVAQVPRPATHAVPVPDRLVPPPSSFAAPLAAAAAVRTGLAPDSVSPGRAFLLSAVIPGGGQHELGLDRWLPYLALEVWAWLRYRDRRSAGAAFGHRYRDLAWDAARVQGEVRRDGDFGYYEAMAEFVGSGSFDMDPGRAGIQPERAEGTFNGSVWELARSLYFPAGVDSLPEAAPEYMDALDYYVERAVGSEFAWSWEGRAAERSRYRMWIRESDEALRSATRTLGVILANHAISAVDALISARLRGGPSGASPVRVRSATNVRDGRMVWTAVVRVPFPRR